MSTNDQPTTLLTGATGYIGGRLLSRFEEQSIPIRAMARTPEHLTPRTAGSTSVVEGDVMDFDSLKEAMDGIEVAYYLIHSLGSSGDFESREAQGARHFADAAREMGVKKIIYLGGLGRGDDLSPHLRSRQRVGEILRESGIPTIEFRASIIIGSGSVSFSLFRALVEKLPLMITPRWVRSKAQPISVEDVLAYLEAARTVEISKSELVEIGGANQVSYEDMMREYARQRDLRRIIIPVPFLSPSLSSRWLSLVTPIYAPVGRKLIEGLRNDTVSDNTRAAELFDIEPMGISDAIARALVNEDESVAATRWSDALSAREVEPAYGGVRYGQRIVDSRSLKVRTTPDRAFAPIRKIGGETGWYYGYWLWQLRGLLDIMVGGVGTRRGRRDPETVFPGETIDFWRVEAVEPDHLLRLRSEMKLPGRAWLQFEVEEIEGGSRIRQTAIFDPVGILGLAYWYALYPFHHFVFRNMLKGIARAIPAPKAGEAVT